MKRRVYLHTFFFFFYLILSKSSFAFDPISVLAVSSAVSSVRSVGDGLAEVSATSSAISELYSEIDSVAEISESAARIIKKMNEMDQLIQEIQFMGFEAEMISKKSDIESLSERVRNITRVIKLGKKASTLFMSLDKKSKIATIENTEINRELLSKLSSIDSRLEEEKLEREKKELETIKSKLDQIKGIHSDLSKKKVKAFKGGLLEFKMNPERIEKAISVGKKMIPNLFKLVGVFFILRCLFLIVTLGDSFLYFRAIQNLITCSFLFGFYPQIIRGIFEITGLLSSTLGPSNTSELKLSEFIFSESLKLDDSILKSFGKFFFLKKIWLFQWIKYICFICIDFFMHLGLACFIAVLPVGFFFTELFGFSFSLTLSALFLFALWPFFWNLIGVLSSSFLEDFSLSSNFSGILICFLQVISPFCFMTLLKSGSVAPTLLSGPARNVFRLYTHTKNVFSNQQRH